MRNQSYYLITFQSKNHAVLLYTILDSKQINEIQLVSTPCSLKVGCSYSLKVLNKNFLKDIVKEAINAGINNYRIYHAQRINGKLTYTEIKLA